MVTETGHAEAHPYNVFPSLNLLLTSSHAEYLTQRSLALGPSFSLCSDETLLHLLSFFSQQELLSTGCCSRLLFIFTSHDPLWKQLALQRWKVSDKYRSTWKFTCIGKGGIHRAVLPRGTCRAYSDVLYKPWQYGTASIPPQWLTYQHGEIIDGKGLTIEEFLAKYERPGRPVLLRNSLTNWSISELGLGLGLGFGEQIVHALKKDPEAVVRVGPVKMQMGAFLEYCAEQREENPLYAFDARFDQALPAVSAALKAPELFVNSDKHPARDLLEEMGEARRPDYRWCIIGAAKSGSKWHVDPNHTHAWNALGEFSCFIFPF